MVDGSDGQLSTKPEDACPLFCLKQLEMGEKWLRDRNLQHKLCSGATKQLKSMDEFVLADDYDTNYSLLLSLARQVELDSRQSMGCYLYQLQDWLCK